MPDWLADIIDQPVFVCAVLSINVVLAEWLARFAYLKYLGSALIVIVITAIVSNLGVIPATYDGTVVYRGISTYVIHMAVFWLLLRVNLRHVLQAGIPMLSAFLIGAGGIVLGVWMSILWAGGREVFGEHCAGIGAMFVGTYTGGSINFNLMAAEYGVIEEPILYPGAMVVDNIVTAIWMVVTIAAPRLLARFWPKVFFGGTAAERPSDAEVVVHEDVSDVATVSPMDLGVLFGMGLLAVWASKVVEGWLVDDQGQVTISSSLILTGIALSLAQVPFVNRLKGTRLLGMFSVYLFLAMIGALCDLRAFGGIEEVGTTLLLFVSAAVLFHGIVVFGLSALFRIDPVVAAVASQANIGGGSTALVLARSLDRPDLELPAILVGALGLALGTFLGTYMGDVLLGV